MGAPSSNHFAIYDGDRWNVDPRITFAINTIVPIPVPYAGGAATRGTVRSVGVQIAAPDALLDVSGNLVIGDGGTLGCDGFSGLLSATLAATPLNGNLQLAERFVRWNQYVTSRGWREEAYVDQPAWWAQWMLAGRDGGATGALSWVTYTGAPTFAGNGYVGAVLLPDGRAMLVPNGPTEVPVFDYVADTWATHSAVSGTSRGGCLLPDGRVLMAPANATVINLFDYATNAVTTATLTADGWGTNTNKFSCATLLPDGRAFVPNLNSAAVSFVFDYRTDAATTVTADARSESVQLLPNGRAMTFRSGVLGFFDYRTNAFTTLAGPTRSGDVAASCLLPDGRALWAFRNGAEQLALLYDFRTNLYTEFAVGLLGAGESFRSLVQLPDGRALGIPYTGSALWTYDYRTDIWTTYAGPGAAYWGGCVLPDGRALLVPSDASLQSAVVSVAGIVRAPSLDACYHPCFNQNP